MSTLLTNELNVLGIDKDELIKMINVFRVNCECSKGKAYIEMVRKDETLKDMEKQKDDLKLRIERLTDMKKAREGTLLSLLKLKRDSESR